VALAGPRLVAPGEPRRFPAYTLAFRGAAYAFSGDGPQVLTVEINGRQLAELTLDPAFREYAFDVPPGFLNRGINVVTLRYSQARSPQDAGRSGDNRPLAARFDYIRLSRPGRP
jgi:hypothetical protein